MKISGPKEQLGVYSIPVPENYLSRLKLPAISVIPQFHGMQLFPQNSSYFRGNTGVPALEHLIAWPKYALKHANINMLANMKYWCACTWTLDHMSLFWCIFIGKCVCKAAVTVVILAGNHGNGGYGTHGFPCLRNNFHQMGFNCSISVARVFCPAFHRFTHTGRSTGEDWGIGQLWLFCWSWST